MTEVDPATIVLIDPDPDTRSALEISFEAKDRPLEVCQRTSPAAVDWDRFDRTDCVVSEYDLPETDGLAVLERAREAVPSIPFVLYTDAGSEDVASEAIAAGVTDYVSKAGASPAVLANRVENLIGQARAEARADKIERVNRVLQDVDAALVRADSRAEIEQAVCDIIADSDQYRFAWVGKYVPLAHRLLPQAFAGVGESFLEEIPVGEDSTLPDRGPGPKSLETGRVQVTQNIERDESFDEFQDTVDAHGYRSVATVPLAHGEQTFGLLAIYADRPNAFDETERDLLESLGADIGHAIDAVEMQADLREFRKAFEHGGHGMAITEPDGEIQHVNDAFVDQTGYDRDELLGSQFSAIQPAAPEAVDTNEGPVESGTCWNREFTATKADGREYYVEQTIAPIETDQGTLQGFVVIQADVSDRRDRETAIRRERETLEGVFETSPTGIVVLSPDGEIVRANNRAEEIMGLTEGSLAGQSHDEGDWKFTTADGEPVPPSEHPFKLVRETESPIYDLELRMELDGGTPIWVTINGAPLFDPDGSLDRIVFTFEDITETKRTQRELQETNRTLDTLIQAAPVAIISQRADGEVTLWNEGAEEIFGWSEADVLGMEQPPIVTEDSRAEYEDLFERVLNGESFTGIEVQRERKDGRQVDLHLSAAPIANADGEIRGAMSVFADLTDQKARERQLRQFRQAVEHAGHAVMITDKEGVISYVNSAFEDQTGYTTEEAIGRTPAILRSEAHDEDYFEDLWETILAGEVWENEVINQRKDGTRMYVDQTIAPVYGSSGSIEHFVAVNNDITERKENELRLERQNKRLEEFASVVSHDLRNPLTVAEGSLELLGEDDPGVERIENALNRMEAIIDDVLTLAREGKTVESIEPLDIPSLAETTVSTVDLRKEAVTVQGEPTIAGDPKRARRILENLYRNAQDHVEGSVSITVGPLESGGFYVADDGPGIDPEDRNQVFESGYTTDPDGTGLGLSIVRRLAEAQNWQVSVTESEAGGARFEFEAAAGL